MALGVLNEGADRDLAKPIEMQERVARCKAALCRSGIRLKLILEASDFSFWSLNIVVPNTSFQTCQH